MPRQDVTSEHTLTLELPTLWSESVNGRCTCGWHKQAPTANELRELYGYHLRAVNIEPPPEPDVLDDPSDLPELRQLTRTRAKAMATRHLLLGMLATVDVPLPVLRTCQTRLSLLLPPPRSRPLIVCLMATFVICALLSGVKPTRAADVLVTTQLQPGWNLAGWTGEETEVDAVFAAVPQLVGVYGWDAGQQRFMVAVTDGTGVRGDLKALTPGMGLWLYVGGNEPVEWVRPHVPESLRVALKPGLNLVAWSGLNDIPIVQALAGLDPSGSWLWNAETRRMEDSADSSLQLLQRGDALWLRVSQEMKWRQVQGPLRIEWVTDWLHGDRTEDQKIASAAVFDEVVDFFVHRFEVVVPGVTVRVGAPNSIHCDYGGKIITLRSGCADEVMAHEYTHATQEYLATRGADGSWGGWFPRNSWIDEGSAVYVHVLYRVQRGETTLSETVADIESFAGFDESPLEERELPYALGFLAIVQLLERAGESSLLDYYRRLQGSNSWEDAFEDVFGLTPTHFYRQFGEYHQTLIADYRQRQIELRPRQLRALVVGPNGEPQPNVEVWAEKTDGTHTYSLLTDENGYAEMVVEEGSFRPTIQWLHGACQIGWYGGADGFTATYSESTIVELPQEGGLDITIRLPRPASKMCSTISGTVLDTDGQPVEGVDVVFWPQDEHFDFHGNGTDAEGRFEVPVRAGGTYEVRMISEAARECTVAGYSDGGETPSIAVGDDGITGIRVTVVAGPVRPQTWITCGPED